MKMCYGISISKDYVPAMCDMGFYYWTVEKNESMVQKYYELAISKENIFAMTQLAQYYYDHNNIEFAKKYCIMAINNNHTESILTFLAYHINNGLNLDKDSLLILLPKLLEVIFDEKIKLYIIENCIINRVYTTIFDVTFKFEKNECDICMDCCDGFIVPSCSHKICNTCFIRSIKETNTMCPYCRKNFT
jgi:hypothetical protein